MFRFHKKSFIIFFVILITEIGIALYVHDKILRPYIGDVLVVILIYYFVKTFLRIRPWYNIIAVTLFAFAVEFAQYLNLVKHLGLSHSRFWVIVIGNSFNWTDLGCYLAGALVLYLIEIKGKHS